MSVDELLPSVAKLVLCRYNADGVCMYGEACYFSHDRATSKFLNVCNYYLKGYCRYGEKCRFDHVKASKLKVEVSDIKRNSSTHTSTPSTSSANPINQSNSLSSVHSSTANPSLLDSSSNTCSSSSVPVRNTLLNYDSNTHCISGDTGVSDYHPVVLDTSWANAQEFLPSFAYSPAQPPSFTSYSEAARSQTAIDPLIAAGYNIFYPGQTFTDGNSLLECSNSPYQLSAGVPFYPQLAPVQPQPPVGCDVLCELHMYNECFTPEWCQYLHGEQCSICCLNALHPTDKEARKKHETECFESQKDDIERAFKIGRSEQKVCGICMDVVYEKASPAQQMFGILSDCTHVFCLNCLRLWRCQKNFDKEVKRSCPECRVVSHLVIPSKYWVDEEDEKKELLQNYKETLSTKDCKYFDKGNGTCPFGVHCFYKHANSKGELVKKENPRYQTNSSGERRLMSSVYLSEAFSRRDSRSYDSDLLTNLLDLSVDDFFEVAAILGWSVDSDSDDDLDSRESDSEVSSGVALNSSDS